MVRHLRKRGDEIQQLAPEAKDAFEKARRLRSEALTRPLPTTRPIALRAAMSPTGPSPTELVDVGSVSGWAVGGVMVIRTSRGFTRWISVRPSTGS